jgi:glycine/D-amino acid oxidase-like deaminating enzyme
VTAPDVAVIGGGIVGTAAAAFLAEGGARVVLFERATLAAGASGRNSGVVQSPFDPVLAQLYVDTLERYRALEARGDGGLGLKAEPAGLMLVSHDVAVAEAAARSVRASGMDLGVEVLGPGEAARVEPGLAQSVAACLVPIGYPVPPAQATRAFGAVGRRAGVGIREGTEVEPLVRDGRASGVRVVATGDELAAGAVLVAAGPWSPALVDPSGAWRPIRPLWGVVVDIALADPPRRVLEEAEIEGVTDAGGRPEADAEAAGAVGEHATETDVSFSLVTAGDSSSVGSTFLEREPDADALVAPILRRGATFVPAIAATPARGVRMCARPLSVDGRPLLGRIPGVDGLWIAAGHGPWGISTGPASAAIVADLILGRRSSVPSGLDPARFGGLRL